MVGSSAQVGLWVAALAMAPASGEPLLLSSFEPDGPKWVVGGQAVREHATHGRFACKVANDGTGYVAITVTDRAVLAKFKGYVLLRVDVFNPHDRPVPFGCRMDDAKSVSYGTRYNNDNCVAPSGASTFEVNLTGLTKSNARNFDQRDRLDLSTLKLVSLFTGPGRRTTLYFDNVRLEGTGLPAVPGLRAFDFGPRMAPVYPGFEGCTDRTVYRADRPFGWVGPERAFNAYMPDSLTGDSVAGSQFRVKVPDGTYEVWFCMDPFGLWAWYPHFQRRTVRVNGREALEQTRTAEEFLSRHYYRHEDREDLPGQDLWAKYIQPRHTVRRCVARVTGGELRIETSSDNAHGKALLFVVLYPEAQRKAGRAWMAALDRRRRGRFGASMVVDVPKPDGQPVRPSPAEKARGFVPFVRHTERDVAVTARPEAGERDRPIVMQAARGEREHAVVGLYPLTDVRGLTVTVGNLSGPGGAIVPASAFRVRKVRNFLKRVGATRMGKLLPYILQEFRTLDLSPGVTRGVWLTLVVPDRARAGQYQGSVTIAAGPRRATLPVRLTVLPFRLDRVTDITLSVTGSTAGPWRAWYPGLEEKWWRVADRVMKNQADHGMNAVTGGPGARIRSIKDGKADIDYADMDRWLALAVKHGLTMPGDSYQGLDVQNLPRHMRKDCIERNDADARRRFGVSCEELLRIVYADVARHAKAKGWPKRVYYFLDEPRPEYQNVQPSANMIALRARACPETLFSGYYSTGGGRDVFFQTMPVSIAHVNEKALSLVKAAGKQIWDYSGDRSRHNIGRWAFFAARKGMGGFLRNGYMYVCSDPYFDFSDDEGSWSVVYPSKNGLNDAVGWERTAEGVDDYRYLLTCERLIRTARSKKRAGPQAKAAAAFMADTLKPITLNDKNTAQLTPAGYDRFRQKLAGHILALRRELGE